MPKWFLTTIVLLYMPFMITLQVLDDRNVITRRTGERIVLLVFAVVLALYLPAIVRKLLCADSWHRAASSFQALPQKIAKLAYWKQVLLGVACMFACYFVWLGVGPWFLLVFPIIAVMCGIMLSAFALWFLPVLQSRRLPSSIDELERAKLENEYRRTMAQLGTAVLLMATIYFTWRQLSATEEGKITDRFSKAVELLSSGNTAARIGGIHALERISKDSPKDYQPVIAILASFVRDMAKRDGTDTSAPSASSERGAYSHRLVDVQAALSVLARRNQDYLHEGKRIFLDHCDLRNALFVDGKFQGFVFDGTDFSNAVMIRTDLRGALLKNGVLIGADLSNARLDEAKLNGANLSGADIDEANLEGADLRNATLKDVRGISTLQNATAANIAGLKASEEERRSLLRKGAVEEPDTAKWQKIKKSKIPFRSLYGNYLDD